MKEPLNYNRDSAIEQLDSILKDLQQRFQDQLVGVLLFGSSVRKKRVLKGDIDLLVATNGSCLRDIICTWRDIFCDQETMYGHDNRIEHMPLLIVNGSLPLFGPSYSCELIEGARPLLGNYESILRTLHSHIAKPPFSDHYKSYFYWELQAACKELMDTYIEYWGEVNEQCKRTRNNPRRTNKRIIKTYFHGLKLVHYLNTGCWLESVEDHICESLDFDCLFRSKQVLTIDIISNMCEKLVASMRLDSPGGGHE